MPSILTVDDSHEVRAAVSRLVEELGFEFAEATDGVEGLATLAECRFDLVLLDVMMPNMDGPDMLARMREGGDTTPVIMLTAESHRPLISRLMKSGIADYVLKPFDHEELSRKVVQVLQRSTCGDIVANSMPGGAAAAGLWAKRGPARRKRLVDLMLVDDMENAHKRLRGMLPRHVTVSAFTCPQSALASAAEHSYRVVLVDTDIPGTDSVVLAQQLRQLQPASHIAALAMRAKDSEEERRQLVEQGFEVVLCKPFAQDEVDDLYLRYFQSQELLTRDGNVLAVAPFMGNPERGDYFGRLSLRLTSALEEVASACHGAAIIDLGCAPAQGERIASLLVSAEARAGALEMGMMVVGPEALQRVLASYEETKAIKCFGTIQEARAAAG